MNAIEAVVIRSPSGEKRIVPADSVRIRTDSRGAPMAPTGQRIEVLSPVMGIDITI